jgi:hypothetical protein
MRQDLDAKLTPEQEAALRNVLPDKYPGEVGYFEGLRELAVVIYARAFGEYQGDNVAVLLNDNGELGLRISYFGSCSGCDPLQACDTADEVVEYYTDEWRNVRWFSTYRELVEYCDDDANAPGPIDDADLRDVAEDLREQDFGERTELADLQRELRERQRYEDQYFELSRRVSRLEGNYNIAMRLLELADNATRAINEHPELYTPESKRAALLYAYKRAQFKPD